MHTIIYSCSIITKQICFANIVEYASPSPLVEWLLHLDIHTVNGAIDSQTINEYRGIKLKMC